MTSFFLLLFTYLIVSFALGAVWHMVLFREYYKKLAIYSRIENPRFVFGLTSMFLQSIVLAHLYLIVGNVYVFGLGLFMILTSFLVFAEVGKQNTSSLPGFVSIQIAYCAVQALLVTLTFTLVPLS